MNEPIFKASMEHLLTVMFGMFPENTHKSFRKLKVVLEDAVKKKELTYRDAIVQFAASIIDADRYGNFPFNNEVE